MVLESVLDHLVLHQGGCIMNKNINTNKSTTKSTKTVNYVNIVVTAAAILTAVVLVVLAFTGCFFLLTKLIIPALKTILFSTINILLSVVIPVYLLSRTRNFKKAYESHVKKSSDSEKKDEKKKQ